MPRKKNTNYRNYDITAPIEVTGGIKAGSKRGAFGNSWWAQRWAQTLDEFELGGRLARGRSYARKGQVIDLEIHQGAVNARVQGSRQKPYDVAISVKPISPEDWQRLQEKMAEQPLIAATLLSGNMPENIEETFTAAGLSMFPNRKADLRTKCSCPDDSNPCKHVAAVYLLLGEEFDRDPFLIFRMRGMDRENLLGPAFQKPPQTQEAATPPKPQQQPLPPDPDEFWSNPVPVLQEINLTGPATAPPRDASLPQQLGRFPLWQGSIEFFPAMQAIYHGTSQRALATASELQ